jgi:hypothetical protein
MKIKSVNFNLVIVLIVVMAGFFYSNLWKDAPFVTPDTPDYIEVADDLRDGKIDEFHYRTPGYPILLLLTNSLEPTHKLFLTQLSLYLLSVFLLANFLHAEGVSRSFVLLFLLLSLIPQSIGNTEYMLTESFTIFSITAGMATLFWFIRNNKWPLSLISGVALAFSALVRPTYQLLVFALIGVLLVLGKYNLKIRKEISIWTGMVLLSWCSILGSFSWYNYINFNYFGLSPVIGFNLSTKTSRVIERLPDEYKEIRELLIAARNQALTATDGYHTGEEYIWDTESELQKLTGLNKVDLANYMLKLNLVLIKKAPLTYLQEVSRALSTYWLPNSTERTNFGSKLLQLAWAAIHFVIIAVFFCTTTLIFSLLVLTRIFQKELKDNILALAKPYNSLILPFFTSITVIAYSMLITVAFEVGNPRHRTPTDILIFFSTTIGLYFLSKKRNQTGHELLRNHAGE